MCNIFAGRLPVAGRPPATLAVRGRRRREFLIKVAILLQLPVSPSPFSLARLPNGGEPREGKTSQVTAESGDLMGHGDKYSDYI